MNRPKVFCVGCGGEIYNDGSMAGQIIECPSCHQQFVMPGGPLSTPPIAMQQREDLPAIHDKPSYSAQSYVSTRRKGPKFKGLALVFGVIFVAVTISFYVFKFLEDVPAQAKDQDQMTQVELPIAVTEPEDPNADTPEIDRRSKEPGVKTNKHYTAGFANGKYTGSLQAILKERYDPEADGTKHTYIKLLYDRIKHLDPAAKSVAKSEYTRGWYAGFDEGYYTN